jgi:hypothetical protein
MRPPDEDERRPGRGGAHKINPGEKISLGADLTAARTVRVLSEYGYPEWVIEGVCRWNRMRADGVSGKSARSSTRKPTGGRRDGPDTENVDMDILGPVIEEAERKAREAALRNGQQEPGPEQDPPEPEQEQDHRRVVLTAASKIKPRRVQWLWDARIALGTLALLAGREGLGKSILSYTIAAMITRGDLPGEFFGTPKSVLVAAAEDSWSQTIVPRLIAAGADLDRVFRVEVIHDTIHSELITPRDLARVKAVAREVDAALMILDPLISRLDPKPDSHRDADVRRALEPLVAMADLINISVLGLIHHNKSGATDPLQVVMASKAFPAVARSVHTVIPRSRRRDQQPAAVRYTEEQSWTYRFADAQLRDQLLCVGGGRRHSLNRTAGVG